MDNKNNINREGLHKEIWKLANELRGSVDGWDFKSYVLGFMFYKFLSEQFEKLVQKRGEKIWKKYKSESVTEEDNKEIKNEVDCGYYIEYKNSFHCILKEIQNDNDKANTRLKEAFDQIEKSTYTETSKKALLGLFNDISLESNKLGNSQPERNKRIQRIMEKLLSLDEYSSDQIDVIGDAYEYLMGMYASSAGKSGGEYYTPQEVSKLLFKLALNDRKSVGHIYDPTCGSGSLLLQVKKQDNLEFYIIYGQEYNNTTYNLCRINMLLHGLKTDKFLIANADTLLSPSKEIDKALFSNGKGNADIIVSNPPYSINWPGSDHANIQNDPRFNVTALAPKSKADFAFILHSLHYLSDEGIASIVCFPGIMYRGGAEQKIRKYLIEKDYIKTIIELPANLFFGTSISTYIMVLAKNKKENKGKVLFINASADFIKETNNNKLSDKNINDIYSLYIDSQDVDYKSKLVDIKDIGEDFNLSVSKYVVREEPKPEVNIKVLNKEIKEIVSKQQELRKQIDKIILDIGDIDG